ncbi:hypothetical protein NW768_008249 [Fusarium equiseti]|uniref:Uncharacterized protein n=1 Tax=Fusarium equiseti TaxID=61235 RepID=A0ABQ8R672_FUSEQ|nr:hypothetical protein NW768_008249 [Fusarium equiseti]
MADLAREEFLCNKLHKIIDTFLETPRWRALGQVTRLSAFETSFAHIVGDMEDSVAEWLLCDLDATLRSLSRASSPRIYEHPPPFLTDDGGPVLPNHQCMPVYGRDRIFYPPGLSATVQNERFFRNEHTRVPTQVDGVDEQATAVSSRETIAERATRDNDEKAPALEQTMLRIAGALETMTQQAANHDAAGSHSPAPDPSKSTFAKRIKRRLVTSKSVKKD